MLERMNKGWHQGSAPARVIRFGLVVVVSLLLVACSRPSVTSSGSQSAGRPYPSPDFPSRIDGSTAAIPLGSALLKDLTGTDRGMVFNTTSAAFDSLIKGDKDLIFVTNPSPRDTHAAEEAGVSLEIIPIAKDALVFFTGADNPVSGLTRDQVKQIYTGQATNWLQVGGNDAGITPYQHPAESADQALFLKLAMGNEQPMGAPAQMRESSTTNIVDTVANYANGPDALGYSVFYYATEMYLTDTMKLLSIDGVLPTRETIADQTYPYVTYYYAVIRRDAPPTSDARRVVDWLLTDAGQQLVARASYITLHPGNIVDPDENDNGYFGATVRTTTESSGTGGTGRRSVDLKPASQVTCDTSIKTLAIQGYEPLAAAIHSWYVDQGFADGCPEVMWTGDVAVATMTQDGRTATTTMLPDGTPARLSDLFFDSVNYISYINQNLFNESTNPYYSDWLNPVTGQGAEPPVGFTGIPSDYQLFSLQLGPAGGSLRVFFPVGNPFLSRAASMDLPLPADLSPYGRLIRADWTRVTTQRTDQIFPVLTTDSTGANDELNQQIRALVDANPGQQCFRYVLSSEYLTILSSPDIASCLDSANGAIMRWAATWDYGTWDYDALTMADLPTRWQEQWTGISGTDRTKPGDAARVLNLWPTWAGLVAEVSDNGAIYNLKYPNPA